MSGKHRKPGAPKGKIEIIIADGSSTDKTLEIARRYTDKIFHNPLRTGEAGKAAGVKEAKNEIIALIHSDNVLPQGDWRGRWKALEEKPRWCAELPTKDISNRGRAHR